MACSPSSVELRNRGRTRRACFSGASTTSPGSSMSLLRSRRRSQLPRSAWRRSVTSAEVIAGFRPRSATEPSAVPRRAQRARAALQALRTRSVRGRRGLLLIACRRTLARQASAIERACRPSARRRHLASTPASVARSQDRMWRLAAHERSAPSAARSDFVRQTRSRVNDRLLREQGQANLESCAECIGDMGELADSDVDTPRFDVRDVARRSTDPAGEFGLRQFGVGASAPDRRPDQLRADVRRGRPRQRVYPRTPAGVLISSSASSMSGTG